MPAVRTDMTDLTTRQPRPRPHRSPLLPTILLAGADAGYRGMVRDALLESVEPADLRFTDDARGLADYLALHDDVRAPRPALILLELGAEPATAIEAVRSIKSNPRLRRIPVVVLAEDANPELVARSYDAGANTYLLKPVTFLALVKLMKAFTAYWLGAAALAESTA
jgi:CheY-like chemotaxis protein